MVEDQGGDVAGDDFGRAFWRLSLEAAAAAPILLDGDLHLETARLIAEALPSPCWVANGDGHIAWYNRRWHAYCGTTPEEMEGWGWQSVHDPDRLPEVLERWRGAIATGEAFEMTFPLRGADGIYRPFLTRIVPVRNAHREIARWVGLNIEVSDLVEMEAELRESEARFRNMADHAPVMMWVTDPTGYCTYLNRGWYEFTGQTPQEAEGAGWLEAIHPDDSAEAERVFTQANASRDSFRMEYRLRRKDGDYRGAIDAAAPRFGPGGEFLGYIGSVIDIEDRRLAEAALRSSEDRLRLATEGADIGTWDLNPVSGELKWDDRCRALFGLPPGAYVDYDVFLAGLHPEDREVTDQAVQAALAPEGPGAYDVEYRTVGLEDGQTRWIAAKGRGHFVGEGPERRAIRFVGTVRDISRRKAAEIERDAVVAALRELNETLEQRVVAEVAERLRAEEALRQAQKMEAVGQLTGGVAHDFNNMLAVVIGSLDLARRRLDSGAGGVERYIDSAHEGAARAAALTQRLLAFSRQQPLSPRILSLNRLVQDMSELLRRTLGETIELETILAGGLWRVNVDPNQLESALVNLAVNARDAMPDGGKLTLETANAHLDDAYAAANVGVSAGQYALIAITDQGQGMTQDVLGRVFDPFFTTKPVGKGTGLGLSMVYGFVKQSGGHVSIYSEPGEGTTVKIYLPRHVGASDERTLAEAPARLPASPGGEVVLVVEDEERVRAMSVAALTELGYLVHQAGGGPEALEMIERLPQLDLLFTDVVMAGMSGRELATRVQARAPHVKVLFTTGYTRNAVVHNGIVDPDVEFISKPFSIAELAAKVRGVLDG